MYFTLYKYIQKRAWGEQKFNPAAIPRGFPLVPKLRKSFSLSLYRYILYIHSSGYIPGCSVYMYIFILDTGIRWGRIPSNRPRYTPGSRSQRLRRLRFMMSPAIRLLRARRECKINFPGPGSETLIAMLYNIRAPTCI